MVFDNITRMVKFDIFIILVFLYIKFLHIDCHAIALQLILMAYSFVAFLLFQFLT